LQYRRTVLTPLRKTLDVAEILFSSGRWSDICYDMLPSLCMLRNKKQFATHDKERFTKYMLGVMEGKRNLTGELVDLWTVIDSATHLAGHAMTDGKKLNLLSSTDKSLTDLDHIYV